MFSDHPRCLYQSSPLAEVICQIRFPGILSIEAGIPSDFQDAIREEYPEFQRRTDLQGLTGVQPGDSNRVNYQFSTPDGAWRINLTCNFIAFSTNRYTRWEEFARRLDLPLAAFIQIYKPAWFERVGLRYLNFFSRQELGLAGVPYRELFRPCYLGPLMEDEVAEQNVSRCTVDTELSLRGGCRARLHAGPGLIRKIGSPLQEVRFIFDQDLYMPGKLPVQYTTGALNTLHHQADSLFRGAITDRLHDAMGPQFI